MTCFLFSSVRIEVISWLSQYSPCTSRLPYTLVIVMVVLEHKKLVWLEPFFLN
jgi:hypothetical protein